MRSAEEYLEEIDHLRAENAKLTLKIAALKDECRGRAEREDRLRVALEEIIKWDDYAHTAKVARAAFEETK